MNVALTDLQAGMTINVRDRDESTPMVRTLTKVERITRKGVKWIYWRWTPGREPDGAIDCGYSGCVLDDESRTYRFNVIA